MRRKRTPQEAARSERSCACQHPRPCPNRDTNPEFVLILPWAVTAAGERRSVTKTSGPSRPGARPRRSTCGAVRGCRVGILQFAAGAIAVGLVCERHPVHGRVEHGVSLKQRRRGGLSQAEALRRPGSVVISVGHGACLSHAPCCNVASLQDETVAAVRLALYVRTLPRRIRGARVTIRRLWSRRSEARTPSMAAPAPSGLTSGPPIFSGDRSGIARLRAPELRARKHMVGPCHGRAAAIGAHDARLRVRRHDREIVGRRRLSPSRFK